MLEAPWRQPAGLAAALGALDGEGQQWPGRGEAPPANTLFEGVFLGEFATIENSQPADGSRTQPGVSEVPETRRCCSFVPDPHANRLPPCPGFHQCSRTSTCGVRRGSPAEPKAGLVGAMQQWGRTGAAVAKLIDLDRATLASCLLADHWARRAVSQFLGLGVSVWRLFLGEGMQARAVGSAACPAPSLAWHPHRDVVASLSRTGAVALHLLGDAFEREATQYLQGVAELGFPLCLEWQPNELSGTLAVGFSCGIALWKRSKPDGWRQAWAMAGEAFACSALAWSPDGRCLATAGSDGVVHVWHHAGLASEQSAPWCVTLRRWWSGSVDRIQWSLDGSLLAVLHAGANGPCSLRLWDTSVWEIAGRVSLSQNVQRSPSSTTSLAWCSASSLLSTAGGELLELQGLRNTGGWTASDGGPLSRTLRLALPPGESVPRAVAEVAVCPRPGQQRVAVRLEGASSVLVFERLAVHGRPWELTPRGTISAVVDHGESGSSRTSTGAVGRACAIAFAGNAPKQRAQGEAYECSLLAVYWDFGSHGSEIRTYPMHYTPQTLVQTNPSALFN